MKDNETIIKTAEDAKGTRSPKWREVVIGGTPAVLLGGAGFAAGAAAHPTVDLVEEAFEEVVDETAQATSEASRGAGIPHIGENVDVAEGVDDEMSFSEAFKTARAEVGAGGVFVWKGNAYGTYYKTEWDAMSDEQKGEYWKAVSGTDIETGDAAEAQVDEVVVDEVAGEPAEADVEETQEEVEEVEEAEEESANEPVEVAVEETKEEVEEVAEAEAPKGVHYVDANGDGEADVIASDTTGDGNVDTIAADTTGDGLIDTVIADTTGDGYVDTKMVDVDGDGIADVAVVDIDGDGEPDVALADFNGDGVIDESEVFALNDVTDASCAGDVSVETETNEYPTFEV